MANCKICGEPVRCARVFHAACWGTAGERELAGFCGQGWRWAPGGGGGEGPGELHCNDCALVRLLNLGL